LAHSRLFASHLTVGVLGFLSVWFGSERIISSAWG
jgi:hypothetical protein